VLGRAGLASDVSVYEHFPPHYIAYARRLHRWIRGDWQLIPWLSPLIPVTGGRLARNPLQLIDRWKIFENLRRSLFFPLLFAFLIASWLLAPSALIVWTLLGVFAPAAHVLVGIAAGVVGGFRRPGRRRRWRLLRSLSWTDVQRWILSVSFTCHLAVVAVNAIARSLTRMFITRRRLLEWVTFSAASARLGLDSMRKSIWLEMWVSMLVAVVTLSFIAFARPAALPYSAPLLLLWIAAPELARWLSVPPRDAQPATLDQRDQAVLRELACRTWRFFESFVGPGSHWLAPDHFQESPRGEVAQRTSPTNIAMMFLATLVARDLGVYRRCRTLSGGCATRWIRLRALPRYRGHILNWVDTSTFGAARAPLCLHGGFRQSCRRSDHAAPGVPGNGRADRVCAKHNGKRSVAYSTFWSKRCRAFSSTRSSKSPIASTPSAACALWSANGSAPISVTLRW